MRNTHIPTFEQFDEAFTGVDGIRYYAMLYYPKGKADKSFWLINLFAVGSKHGEHFASADAYLKRKADLTQWDILSPSETTPNS